MRSWFALAFLFAASLASADRLITIPTARKLLDGSLRLESLRQFGAGDRATDYLAAGFAKAWEAEARVLEQNGRERVSGDLTYNIVAPLTGFSPGFAAGVQDLGDQTRLGLRGFLCTTLRSTFDRGNTPFDVTSGVSFGRRVRPFVGTSVPIYGWLRLLAEHDGSLGQAALEATPVRGLRLRLVARPGAILGSLGYTVKF